MIPTGNSLNKILKISELSPDDTEKSVLGLFANPSRVTKVNFSQERGVRSALIHF